MKTIVYGAEIALMLVCLLPFYSAAQFTNECNETNISNKAASHIPIVDINWESKFSEFLIDQRKNCSNESDSINSSVNTSPYAFGYSVKFMEGVIEIKDAIGWTNKTGSKRWDCEDRALWTNKTGSRRMDWEHES